MEKKIKDLYDLAKANIIFPEQKLALNALMSNNVSDFFNDFICGEKPYPDLLHENFGAYFLALVSLHGSLDILKMLENETDICSKTYFFADIRKENNPFFFNYSLAGYVCKYGTEERISQLFKSHWLTTEEWAFESSFNSALSFGLMTNQNINLQDFFSIHNEVCQKNFYRIWTKNNEMANLLRFADLLPIEYGFYLFSNKNMKDKLKERYEYITEVLFTEHFMCKRHQLFSKVMENTENLYLFSGIGFLIPLLIKWGKIEEKTILRNPLKKHMDKLFQSDYFSWYAIGQYISSKYVENEIQKKCLYLIPFFSKKEYKPTYQSFLRALQDTSPDIFEDIQKKNITYPLSSQNIEWLKIRSQVVSKFLTVPKKKI